MIALSQYGCKVPELQCWKSIFCLEDHTDHQTSLPSSWNLVFYGEMGIMSFAKKYVIESVSRCRWPPFRLYFVQWDTEVWLSLANCFWTLVAGWWLGHPRANIFLILLVVIRSQVWEEIWSVSPMSHYAFITVEANNLSIIYNFSALYSQPKMLPYWWIHVVFLMIPFRRLHRPVDVGCCILTFTMWMIIVINNMI